MNAREGEDFLDSIVTGDETWIFHHTPESRQAGKMLTTMMRCKKTTHFKGQAANFYDSGIQKLVPRLNKRLDNADDYVER